MNNFSWLPENLRAHVERLLAREMPRGRGEAIYRKPPAHLTDAEVNGKRHLVFVCYYANPSTIKKSAVLRQTGKYYTTLVACCIREDLEIESWFDQAYEIAHYTELLPLLSGASPAAITACIQPALLAALVEEACPGTRVVVDVNDSNFFMRGDPNLPDLQLERAVLQKADAFVHKMPARAVAEIRKAWGVDTPDFLTALTAYAGTV